MPKTSITINRPPSIVWKYFTDCNTWEEWYGGALKQVDPGWLNGAKLIWKLGGSSTLESVVEGQETVIVGSHMKTWYRFIAQENEATCVEVEFTPRGGASFSDGGQAHLANMKTALSKLKQCIEKVGTHIITTEKIIEIEVETKESRDPMAANSNGDLQPAITPSGNFPSRDIEQTIQDTEQKTDGGPGVKQSETISNLDATIKKYTSEGYTLISRTGMSASLKRQTPVDLVILIGLLLIFPIGAIIYLFVRKKYQVQLVQQSDGQVTESGGTLEEFERDRAKEAKRPKVGWALLFLGILIAVTGGLFGLILLMSHLSDPVLSKDPGATVTTLLICPTPIIIVGLLLLAGGIYILRRAEKDANIPVSGQTPLSAAKPQEVITAPSLYGSPVPAARSTNPPTEEPELGIEEPEATRDIGVLIGTEKEKQKMKAREEAQRWWKSSQGDIWRSKGGAKCDVVSSHIIEDGQGYLCKPKTPGDSSPDLVCEECFDKFDYEAWEISSDSAMQAELTRIAQDVAFEYLRAAGIRK